jgi:hypothetical protein
MVARRKELHLAMVANIREELSLEADAKLREVRGHRERVSGAFHPCEPPPPSGRGEGGGERGEEAVTPCKCLVPLSPIIK